MPSLSTKRDYFCCANAARIGRATMQHQNGREMCQQQPIGFFSSLSDNCRGAIWPFLHLCFFVLAIARIGNRTDFGKRHAIQNGYAMRCCACNARAERVTALRTRRGLFCNCT
eukprot:6214267-Pleurochrysis_carterae.AAC.1